MGTAIDGIERVIKESYTMGIYNSPENIGFDKVLPFLEKMEKLSIKTKVGNEGELFMDFIEKDERQRTKFYLEYFYKHFPNVHISFSVFSANQYALYAKFTTPVTDRTSFTVVKAYLESVGIFLRGENWLGQISTDPNEFALCFFSAEDKAATENLLRKNLFKEDQFDLITPDLVNFVKISLLALQHQIKILDPQNIQQRLRRIIEFMRLEITPTEQLSIDPNEELYSLLSNILKSVTNSNLFSKKEKEKFQKWLGLIPDLSKKKNDGMQISDDSGRFQKMGGDCFNSGKFPEALFWFFQYQQHNMGGKSHPNVNVASSRCSDKWKGFINFLKKKYESKEINASTDWLTVKELWNTRFQKMGGERYNTGQFPEATFWFFQHQMHSMNGKRYPNVSVANSRCKGAWKDFSRFLEEKYKCKEINIDTDWITAEKLWNNRVEVTPSTTTTTITVLTPASTSSMTATIAPITTSTKTTSTKTTSTKTTSPVSTKTTSTAPTKTTITKKATSTAPTKTTITKKTSSTKTSPTKTKKTTSSKKTFTKKIIDANGNKIVTIIKKKKKKKKKKIVATTQGTTVPIAKTFAETVSATTSTIHHEKKDDVKLKLIMKKAAELNKSTEKKRRPIEIKEEKKVTKRKRQEEIFNGVLIGDNNFKKGVGGVSRVLDALRNKSHDYSFLPEVAAGVRDVRDVRHESDIHDIMPVCDLPMHEFPASERIKILDLRVGSSDSKKIRDLRKSEKNKVGNGTGKKVLDLRPSYH